MFESNDNQSKSMSLFLIMLAIVASLAFYVYANNLWAVLGS